MTRNDAPAVIVKTDLQEYLNQLSTARSLVPRVRFNTDTGPTIGIAVSHALQRYRGTWAAAATPGTALVDRFYQQRVHLRLVKADNVVIGGFAVIEGELKGLWCVRHGCGDWIMREAVSLGADRLDCFDGYLPAFYAKHGFREVLREKNHEKHGPDVVWMRRP